MIDCTPRQAPPLPHILDDPSRSGPRALARGYAVIAAGRKFQARFVGAPELDRFAAEDQQRAWLALQREQAATADINVFRASDEIARKVNRGRLASPRRFAK